MERAGGEIQEFLASYQYLSENIDTLPVYISPQCQEEQRTMHRLSPGERFDGMAEWRVSSRQLEALSESSANNNQIDGDDDLMLVFIKLRDGRGWVEMFHPVTGGQLCVRV